MLLATLFASGRRCCTRRGTSSSRRSDDRELGAWGQYLAGALLFLPVLAFTGLPAARAWPFLAGSAVVHVGYVYALTTVYRHGDFSLVYPLARGGGALTAVLLGAVVLSDTLHAGEWAALLVVAFGLATLVRPGARRAEVGYAVLTAIVIGTYTVIDTAGARRTDNGFAYGIVLTVWRGRRPEHRGSDAWPRPRARRDREPRLAPLRVRGMPSGAYRRVSSPSASRGGRRRHAAQRRRSSARSWVGYSSAKPSAAAASSRAS